MHHVYTYGTQSIQFMILTPAQAQLFDKFTKTFFEAQQHFLDKNGRRWTPDEPIEINTNNWSKEDDRQYNKLVKRVNLQHKIRNKIFSILRLDVRDEVLEDFLVKRF